MTLATMRAQLQRIFGDLDDTAADLIINQAVQEVDSAYPWPYREASVTGVAPLAIPDLGEIESVTSETNHRPLEPTTYGALLDAYGDLTTSGDAWSYYIAWPAGVPTVATYPSDSDSIGVQYYKTSPTLSADSDQPIAPDRFHFTYVATACRIAAADAEGNSGFWQAEADRGLQTMVNSLLPDQMDGAAQRILYTAGDW